MYLKLNDNATLTSAKYNRVEVEVEVEDKDKR